MIGIVDAGEPADLRREHPAGVDDDVGAIVSRPFAAVLHRRRRVTRPRSTPIPTTRVCVRIWTPAPARRPPAPGRARTGRASRRSAARPRRARRRSTSAGRAPAPRSRRSARAAGRTSWPSRPGGWSSSKRSGVDASRSDPTSCHDGSDAGLGGQPRGTARRRTSSSSSASLSFGAGRRDPAEWNVEPDVSSARSTRTTSVQPRSARWYAIDVPPTPPPMITARAWSAIRPPRSDYLATDKAQRSVRVRRLAGAQWQDALPASATSCRRSGRTASRTSRRGA